MITAELVNCVLEGVGEASGSSGSFIRRGEALTALNEAQQVFCFLTLCLESTGIVGLQPGTPWTVLNIPDLILPLRCRLGDGPILKPLRLSDLASLNPKWTMQPDANPKQYAVIGWRMLITYPVFVSGGRYVNLTYARSPAKLVNDADLPEIREECHRALLDYAIPRCRLKEGSNEFASQSDRMGLFLEAAGKEARVVRARNLGQRYDRLPPAEQFFDSSKLFDIAKKGGQTKWPTMLQLPQARVSA